MKRNMGAMLCGAAIATVAMIGGIVPGTWEYWSIIMPLCVVQGVAWGIGGRE
jgi:hypothetical protein